MKTIKALVLIIGIAASATAERIYVPAAGTGPGEAGSRWATELTIHNASTEAANLSLTFHNGNGRLATSPLVINGRTTITRDDIVRTLFNLDAPTGALTIEGSATDLAKTVIATRVFNRSDQGEFGQEIPSFTSAEATTAGKTAIVPGPADETAARFNFGVFAIEATVIEWSLIRRNGSVAATSQIAYAPESHRQYNRGAETLFASSSEPNDVVYARVVSGRAIAYGSVVNQLSNDPTFIRARVASGNQAVRFLGVDLDENGTVDLVDSDNDGRLDGTVEVITGSFPNYFRIVAEDPEGKRVTYSLVNGPRDAEFIDTNGTLLWYPSQSLKGTTSTLVVRVSDDGDSRDLVIPVVFR